MRYPVDSMRWVLFSAILCLAVIVGGGCASKDEGVMTGEATKDAFVERRTAEPPEPPPNIPPPTPVQPESATN